MYSSTSQVLEAKNFHMQQNLKLSLEVTDRRTIRCIPLGPPLRTRTVSLGERKTLCRRALLIHRALHLLTVTLVFEGHSLSAALPMLPH